MMRPVVEHMAALAEAAQVAQAVIGRIVIEVRGGKYDTRRPAAGHVLEVRPVRGAAAAIAPGLVAGIEPSSIRQAANARAVRPAATFTDAAGALETDAAAELAPVRGIEVAEFGADRHVAIFRCA